MLFSIQRMWIVHLLVSKHGLETYAHVELVGFLFRGERDGKKNPIHSPSLDWFPVVRNTPFFQSPSSSPFLSLLFYEKSWEMGPQVPSEAWSSITVFLMDVRCVWEEAIAWVCFMLVLSMMSREAAGDEQKPPLAPNNTSIFNPYFSPSK